jgi:hypothetical protein
MAIAHPTTIGMRNAPLSTWLERREADAPQLVLRDKLIAEKSNAVLALIPPGDAAVRELGEMLGARDGLKFPHGALEILATLGRSYAEDICILTKTVGAPYILSAGVLCFPNRWHLTEKIGKPLLQVHAPVPEYADKLSSQVDFFLERLRPGRCFQRSNWGVASVPHLHLPDPVPPVNLGTDTDFYVRHEGQAFVKLPQTGAVIFTIRTTVTHWRDVPEDDRNAIVALSKDIGPDWLAYKSITPHV